VSGKELGVCPTPGCCALTSVAPTAHDSNKPTLAK